MRIDQGTSPNPSPAPSPDRPSSPRTRANWASTGLLALLMAGTSWAVASWAHPWLVLPYLMLMAWLLFPSTSAGRRLGELDSEGSEASENPRSAWPGGDSDDADSPSDGADSSGLEDDGSESEPGGSSKPARARRGKARARKGKPQAEPTEATWVQVAPGKFVRVEAADEASGQAGPHSPVGIPVEVPTAPQPLEFEGGEPTGPAEGRAEVQAPQGAGADASPDATPEGLEPPEGPIEDAEKGDPTGDVESGPETSLEASETAELPGYFEETSAADGNAPQMEEPSESPEAWTPEAPFEGTVEGRPRLESVEESEKVGDPSTYFEDPEPALTEALADVPPEDADGRRATLEGTDPTETPVDETDLDDAGPLELAPAESTPSEDADPPGKEALPRPSKGPSCWPWRLRPRAQTRVGQAMPRSTGRPPPPGRIVRSSRGARRPPDPRRLERRGLARPRQVNRPFPPRSPPLGRPGSGQGKRSPIGMPRRRRGIFRDPGRRPGVSDPSSVSGRAVSASPAGSRARFDPRSGPRRTLRQ